MRQYWVVKNDRVMYEPGFYGLEVARETAKALRKKSNKKDRILVLTLTEEY